VRVLREPPGDLAVAGGPPLLVVYDRGATARGPAPARRVRHTSLVVLPSLVPAVSDLADDADLVLLQRLPPHEAELAARLWRLTPAMTEVLRTLPDRGVVLLGRNLWRRVDLVTGPRETAILGPVRRGD
jgi:ESX secretion system protein EccE